MNYIYGEGLRQPDREITAVEQQSVSGHAIGILVLDLSYPFLPGNAANATTFRFPVLYRILKGVGVQAVHGDQSVLETILSAASELESQGVRAIVGSCGYLGNYQTEVAAAIKPPVFLSSLLQVPLISSSLKPEQKVGIICATKEHLTPALLAKCGITDLSRIVLEGAEDLPEFSRFMAPAFSNSFNPAKAESEMANLAQGFVQDHPEIGALLLECSDMPPHAWAMQQATGRPVYDLTTMIHWIYGAVVRHPFAGFL